MNAAEHKAKAEELLAMVADLQAEAGKPETVPPERYAIWAQERSAALAAAQVHATLATTGI